MVLVSTWVVPVHSIEAPVKTMNYEEWGFPGAGQLGCVITHARGPFSCPLVRYVSALSDDIYKRRMLRSR